MTLAEAVPADDHGHREPAAPSEAPAPQAEAVVDLDAIAHNVRILRDSARDAAMMAVVKADRKSVV